MQFAVAMRKHVGWRGGNEPFANVYNYQNDLPSGFATLQGYQDLVTALANAEKQVHSTSVTFVEGYVWSVGATPAENELIGVFPVSGAGVASPESSMDREATFLVQWRTSRPSITGRPVTLKKYIHACSLLGGLTPAVMSGNTQLHANTVGALTTYGNAVKSIQVGTTANVLVAPSSVDRVAGETYVHPWIEHHEFRY